MTLEGMMEYFPASYPKDRQCDRDYLFNVANTLHGNIVKELVETALNQRYDVKKGNYQNESILLNEHWKDELKSLPFVTHVSNIFMTDFFIRKKDEWCRS